MLLMFEYVNVMGVVLEGGDVEKRSYLTSVITTSSTFEKSTYATWIRERGYVVKAFLDYWLSWFVLSSGQEDGLHYMYSCWTSYSRRERSSHRPCCTWDHFKPDLNASHTWSTSRGGMVSLSTFTHASCRCSCGSISTWWLRNHLNTRRWFWKSRRLQTV